MTRLAYSILAVLVALTICFFFIRRTRRRDFDREPYGREQETSGASEWDSLDSELGTRIFDPEDSEFIASETSRQTARKFRRERTALALDWLRATRGQVNQLMRAHLKASRANDDLKPADEIRLWFDFLLFQVTSGILYLVIWVCGPPRAGEFVGYSLELVGKLRDIAEDVLPASSQAVVELMNDRREPKNGDAIG